MTRLLFLLALPLITASACSDAAGPGPQQPLPNGEAEVSLELVATGLSFPLMLTAPPGDPRLFIVEKVGRIRIVANGTVLEQPFLDISPSVSRGGEQGLLGLAFSPDYSTDGRFFVNYTDTSGDTRLSAFTVSSDPNVADAAIPPGNPFAGAADDRRDELWDLGLRNPWRFSFDRSTGDLYIADVGQNSREEINAVTAAAGGGRGVNYGWNVMEGMECFGGGSCDRDGLTLPVLDYGRSDGCSVTGGFVYRGSAIPEIQGLYFYSDYCQGWVRSFRLVNSAATDQRQWPTLAPGGGVPSFGEDASGELYVLDAGGAVYRIVRDD